MFPLFSVIITVYNKSDYIVDTINSVLNQRYSNFEIIVVDDGSDDNSLKLINALKDTRIKVHSKNNGGAASSRNYGMRLAKGTFIAFLDGDDLWHEDFLESIKAAIDKTQDQHVFATALAHKYNEKLKPSKYCFQTKKEIEILDFFSSSLNSSILTSSSVVMSKNLINTIGFFNEKLVTGEDLEYWIRIGLKYKIVCLKYDFLQQSHGKYHSVPKGLEYIVP